MADEQAPAVAGLDDEALAGVLMNAVLEPNGPLHPRFGELPLDSPVRAMYVDGARAVRAHVLRTLAALAGDPEALGRAAHEAVAILYQTRRVLGDYDVIPWDELDDPVQEEYCAEAQAVARAAVAPVAMALMQAREALDTLDRAIPLPTSTRCAKAMSAALPSLAPLPAAVQAAVDAHDRGVVERLAGEATVSVDDLGEAVYARTRTFMEYEEAKAAIEFVAARVQAAAEVREAGLRSLAGQWEKTTDAEMESRATGDCGGSAYARGVATGMRDCGARLHEAHADPSPAVARIEAVIEAACEMDAHPCHTTHSDECACSRLRQALRDLDGDADA